MISFSQYYESKKILLDTVKNTLTESRTHEFNKYSTVPFYKDGERVILKLKVGQLFETHWKYLSNDLVKLDRIIIESVEYSPYWDNNKMISWLENNTKVSNSV